jgi:hypothetical protein
MGRATIGALIFVILVGMLIPKCEAEVQDVAITVTWTGCSTLGPAAEPRCDLFVSSLPKQVFRRVSPPFTVKVPRGCYSLTICQPDLKRCMYLRKKHTDSAAAATLCP